MKRKQRLDIIQVRVEMLCSIDEKRKNKTKHRSEVISSPPKKYVQNLKRDVVFDFQSHEKMNQGIFGVDVDHLRKCPKYCNEMHFVCVVIDTVVLENEGLDQYSCEP
jgi:hypothetical protein